MADLSLDVDRITWREGQRLIARDLQDDRERRAVLRRLHVRHVHDTWGIATGFEIGAAAPSTVAVGPGHAIDDAGRDLVLSTSLALSVPDVDGPSLFVLVATYLPDCGFTSASNGAVCLDAPLNPRRERPAFAWRDPLDLRPGPEIPLCHVVVEKGVIKGAVQTRVRRYARRLVRPYIATGVSDVDDDGWKPWWRTNILIGFEREVNTADAGFTSLPVYLADVVVTAPDPKHPADEVSSMIAAGHGHILRATASSFVYRLIVPEPFVLTMRNTWAVAWTGIEPLSGCPPALNLKHLFTLAGRFLEVI